MTFVNFDPAYATKAQERAWIKNGTLQYLSSGKNVTMLPEQDLYRFPLKSKYNASIPEVQALNPVAKKPTLLRRGLKMLIGR